MKRLLPILSVLALALSWSCKKDTLPDVLDAGKSESELKHEQKIHFRDSVLNIYKGISQENRILSVYKVIDDTLGNHFVTGNIKGGYWIGAFNESNNMLSERYFIIPDSLNFNRDDSVILRLTTGSGDVNAFFFYGSIVTKKDLETPSVPTDPFTQILCYYNYETQSFPVNYITDRNQVYSIQKWYKGGYLIRASGDYYPQHGVNRVYITDEHLKINRAANPDDLIIPDDYLKALSYSDYLQLDCTSSGIFVSRNSLFPWKSDTPPFKEKTTIWLVKKEFSGDWSTFYPNSEYRKVTSSYELNDAILSVFCHLTGVQQNCSTCSETHKVDEIIQLRVNILTGEEVK